MLQLKSARSRLLPDRAALPHVLVLSLILSVIFSLFYAKLLNDTAVHITTFAASPRPKVVRCCGPDCRAHLPSVEKHYNDKYFAWQTRLGREKAKQTNWDALLGTRPTDVVADLGAGGGHILATLNVSRRIAVEINGKARAGMKQLYPNIESYAYPEQVADNSVDILYSTSALEHFECPLTELREMARKVKVGGKVFIGVKNEGVQYAVNVRDDDINQHLWTWNKQLLYNFVKQAGFQVIEVTPNEAQLRREAKYWDGRSFSSTAYHWAKGVKKVESPKLV